jgi:hypothetical protein
MSNPNHARTSNLLDALIRAQPAPNPVTDDPRTARVVELLTAVDRVLYWYDDWVEDRREEPRQAFWDAVDDMIKLFAEGSLPSECRNLDRHLVVVAQLIKAIEEGALLLRSDRFAQAFGQPLSLRDRALEGASTDVLLAFQDQHNGSAPPVRRRAAEKVEAPAKVEKPYCPESSEELFALDPPISFHQLMMMKGATMEEVHAEARRCGAINHLPTHEQEAARAALKELQARRRERDEKETTEVITAACAAANN